MTQEEELAYLRAETAVWREIAQEKNHEAHQLQQEKQVLCEGLKEAIQAIERLQEHAKVLEGQIEGRSTCCRNVSKPWKGNKPKIATTATCHPPPIGLCVPPRVCGKKAGRNLAGRKAIVAIISSKWRCLTQCSFIESNAVSTASKTCVMPQRNCQSDAK